MKTFILLPMTLIVLLFSCAKDDELVKPDISAKISNRHVRDWPGIDVAEERRCVSVAATHILSGIGTSSPVREMALESTSILQYKRYVIHASGDALSEVYLRGRSQLHLVFHSQTRRLSGVLKTDFYQGESMEIPIDAIAQMSYEGRKMRLKSNITSAKFTIEDDTIDFSHGELDILLPMSPEGRVSVQVVSDIRL